MNTAAGAASIGDRPLQSQRSSDSQLSRTIVRSANGISNGCLWVTIFAVPLMMAGIRETGIAVFICCTFLMGITWATQQMLSPETGSAFSPAVILCGAAVALVGLQLVPLPRSLAHQLSPFSAGFLSAWNSNHTSLTGEGYWTTISLTPSLTRSGFVLLIAYVTFFLTLLQKLRTTEDIDNVLRLVALATVIMAVIGIGQLFFGNGDFLWMFSHPFRDSSWPAKGTFTNQNHFAHFLALGIGPLVWWWKNPGANDTKSKRKKGRRGFGASQNTESYQQAIGSMLAIVIFAGVLSFSRGGVASIAIASFISLATIGRQWTSILRLAVPAIIFMTIGVALFGTDLLESKWNQITESESLEDLSRGRALLWTALLAAAPSFWPAGAGVGSHAEVYPTWMKEDFGKRLSHAESGYLQVLIETGLPGLLLLTAAIGLCFYWAAAARKASTGDARMRVTILFSGLLVSVLHSVMDFVWYIPACLIFTLILAACLCRIHQLHRLQSHSERNTAQYSAWSTCWAMIIIFMALPVGRASAAVVSRDAQSEASWMAYREQSITAGKNRNYESLQDFDDRLDDMIAHLEKCLSIDPADFRAMADLSGMYLRRFERNQQGTDNPMSVQEIRNTVESTEFESSKEILSWLKRAFPENVVDLYRARAIAQKAVRGQPLRAESYVVLAQTGFLNQLSSEDTTALVDQALKLRPYKAPVLYFAGVAEAEKGNVDQAYEWWKKAFHQSKEIKPLIIKSLAAHMTPQEIIGYIDPGAEGLWMMFDEYEKQDHSDHQALVAVLYSRRFPELLDQVTKTDQAFWFRSYEVFEYIGEKRKAVSCLGRTIKLRPADYQLRKRYGLALLDIQEKKAARKELEWCQLRNPNDQDITDALVTAEQALSAERAQ